MPLPSSKTSLRRTRPASPRCRGGVSSVLRLAPASSLPGNWIELATERLSGSRNVIATAKR